MSKSTRTANTKEDVAALSTPSEMNSFIDSYKEGINKCGDEKKPEQVGGKKGKKKISKKKSSKKPAKKSSKKPAKKSSKKPSKKHSKKLSRDLNPVMKAFIELKAHIGSELKKIGGNAGPIASTVTKLYILKALGSKAYDTLSSSDKVDLYKKVKSLFDSESEAERKKVLTEAQKK